MLESKLNQPYSFFCVCVCVWTTVTSNKNNVHPRNKVTALDAEQQKPLSIKTKYKLIRLILSSSNSIINFYILYWHEFLSSPDIPIQLPRFPRFNSSYGIKNLEDDPSYRQNINLSLIYPFLGSHN